MLEPARAEHGSMLEHVRLERPPGSSIAGSCPTLARTLRLSGAGSYDPRTDAGAQSRTKRFHRLD